MLNPQRFNPADAPSALAITVLPDPPAAEESKIQNPKSKIGKLSFGFIAKKKEDTKTAYPVIPDQDGALAILAERIIDRTRELETIEGALKLDKSDLKTAALPFYFRHSAGKTEVPSSISVTSPKGEVLVTFQNRYTALPDETSLVPILGDNVSRYYRQSFELKIDGDKLPVTSAQQLLDELQALFERHHSIDALSVKATIKPCVDFHARRHLELTPEQNLALDNACPMVPMIKTKGRK